MHFLNPSVMHVIAITIIMLFISCDMIVIEFLIFGFVFEMFLEINHWVRVM